MIIRGYPLLWFLHFRRVKKVIFLNIFQWNYINSSLNDIIIKIIAKFYWNKIVFFYQNRPNVHKGVPFVIFCSFSKGEKIIILNIFQLNYIHSSLNDRIIKIIVKFYENKFFFFYQNRLIVHKGLAFAIITSFSKGEKSNYFEYISIKLYPFISKW